MSPYGYVYATDIDGHVIVLSKSIIVPSLYNDITNSVLDTTDAGGR